MAISYPMFNNRSIAVCNRAPDSLFEKIVIKAGTDIPENLDVRGCIAFTRDKKLVGFLHKLIYLVQKILAIFHRRPLFDPYMMHGVIVLEKDKRRPGRLIVSHAVKHKDAEIKSDSTDHIHKNEVTEMIFYRPRNPKLIELLANYGAQTCFPSHIPENERGSAGNRGRGKFSIPTMIACVFVPPTLRRHADKRIAMIAADLLLKNQLKTVNGKKQESFFCTPYALAVLQGSVIVNAIPEAEKEKLIQLNDRAKITDAIFRRYKEKTQDPISKTYWENKILRIKTRFASSAQVCEVLDSLS